MSGSDSWDQKYKNTEFLYSENPNEFLQSNICNIGRPPAGTKALMPCDGDGRNGLWLSTQGYHVEAFDYSPVAVEKSNKRALEKNLPYQSQICDFETYEIKKNNYDLVALIYCHMPKSQSKKLLELCESSLKKGGNLIIEVFSQNQLAFTSGGPKDINLLYTEDEFFPLKSVFEQIQIEKKEIELKEGPLHTGTASVIRVFGKNRL